MRVGGSRCVVVVCRQRDSGIPIGVAAVRFRTCGSAMGVVGSIGLSSQWRRRSTSVIDEIVEWVSSRGGRAVQIH